MSPGAISSRSEPTALKATIAFTPMLLNAAMLARDGTVEGVIWWLRPWRAMKAMDSPLGRLNTAMGDEGFPHGCDDRCTRGGEQSAVLALRRTVLARKSSRTGAHSIDLDVPNVRQVVELVQP